MHKSIKAAAILGVLAVSIGAFGAHGLNTFLTETGRLDTFETAVKYHFYHTLALLLIGLLQQMWKSKFLDYAANLFLAGIFIFSGSLYALCLSQLTILGAITPIGGLMLIGGWLMLFIAATKKPDQN
ncbi:DUF423 domain-containing protein [Fulvivirga lutea]|uniref:DUF423 domain-containing protein n=1 Tax=Fulvivirga lutea TaxID=2810512 RepID=A0A975A2A6_9BACT|nr:DUF423 domain-containing protein [Fulvivirga lutea]QSE99085.1 DUF423 domain-containing protein [Fulvivirga lutea]